MILPYRLNAWRRGLNTLVRALLRIGLGPRHTYLLTVRGRVTGRPYSTPVTLVEQTSGRWLVAPYGEVAWVRNARAAGRVTLSRGRHREDVSIVPVPPETAGAVLKQYATEVPITRPFFGARWDAPVAEFVAEAPHHPVFRIVGEASAPAR
jgi:deazaflavin-dependent oxidoreductase (nitroreductase family)